jgi:hypothetical protein
VATGGTARTSSTDAACFSCLGQFCATDCAYCDTTCERQLRAFRVCAYERQYGLGADQNGVVELYGEAQQDACMNVVSGGDPALNLDPATASLVGCASDTGIAREAACFVFTG